VSRLSEYILAGVAHYEGLEMSQQNREYFNADVKRLAREYRRQHNVWVVVKVRWVRGTAYLEIGPETPKPPREPRERKRRAEL
jgi:hypothetical protein